MCKCNQNPEFSRQARKLQKKKDKELRAKDIAQEKINRWLAGEYVPETKPDGSMYETETVADFIKRGGTVKVLKPLTKGKYNQRMYLKRQRSMKGRMK